MTGSASPTTVSVFEFYNASLDDYFITYVTDEIAKLDHGTCKGWACNGPVVQRLGHHAERHACGMPHLHPAGQGDGHFLCRDANECDGTMAKYPTFILECNTFFYP